MTDTQLYLAIGIPALLALANLGVMLTMFTDLSRRIGSLEDKISRISDQLSERIDQLTGAVNDLDKRLIKVEIKLNIQP
jgi:hypothetical protein